MFKKNILKLAVCVGLIASLTFNISATTHSYIVDNDATTSSGNSNSSTGTWNYMSYGYLYNGDARKTTNGSYYWNYPSFGPNATCDYSLDAYVNHADFTTTVAVYYMEITSSNNYNYAYFNQDTATSGWNYGIISGRTANFRSSYAKIDSGDKTTGADAIRINFIV